MIRHASNESVSAPTPGENPGVVFAPSRLAPGMKEIDMDFVEKLFGLALDGGSGAFEFTHGSVSGGVCYLALKPRLR